MPNRTPIMVTLAELNSDVVDITTASQLVSELEGRFPYY